MAKDFAFLFKPGDYLRDTQCLSEKTQVAYDRIMCEHMRNICISKQQLNFFTKRLSDIEKEELLMTLNEINDGYEIEWVAESIRERIAYSDSRRDNRLGKKKKHMKTYDKHMEGENESENIIKEKEKDIDTRKQKFLTELEAYSNGKYTTKMLQDFYNYWTELNPSKTRMHFEMEKTFEIGKRLATWLSNENKYKLKNGQQKHYGSAGDGMWY